MNFARLFLAPMSNNARSWAKYVAHYKRPIKVSIYKGAPTTNIGQMRHSHLVEFGFKHWRAGKIPPNPYLRPAFDEEYQGYINTYKGILRKKIDAAVKKHNGRSGLK